MTAEPLEAEFHPASAERWNDVVAVMQSCSYSKNCWCAYWYLSNAAYREGWGSGNKVMLEDLVKSGAEPGLLAYVDGQPAGWVSVAPRNRFDRLNRSRNFAPVDEVPVWAVNCFIVSSPYRRRGLMTALAKAAGEFALSRGAPGVEAYPLEPSDRSDSTSLYVGTPAAFLAAGYVEVARRLPRRPIMRLMRT